MTYVAAHTVQAAGLKISVRIPMPIRELKKNRQIDIFSAP
jgi:hypothetical protein